MILLIASPSNTGEKLELALSAELNAEDPPLRVNWTGARVLGETVPVLNANSRTDKLRQLIRLKHQGVRVPDISFVSADAERWLPRTRFHEQGRDFTRAINPEFFVERIHADDEWRLHFFRTAKGNSRLLRSGLKLPRTRNFHPWVRSHRLGWKISYRGGAPAEVVTEGRKAFQALDLDFAAVDILHSPQGGAWVLEVNTCPGLDTGTLEMYVDQIVERAGKL